MSLTGRMMVTPSVSLEEFANHEWASWEKNYATRCVGHVLLRPVLNRSFPPYRQFPIDL